MECKKGQITTFVVVGIVILVILGAIIYFRVNMAPKIVIEVNKSSGEITGMPNPAAGYCGKMNYKYESRDVFDKEGELLGVGGFCIFPDGSECEEWAFYRGKCGQKWSYCIKQGYDMKNLSNDEGWMSGVVCLTKDKQKQKIGTVYDLMNLSPNVAITNKR